ncbi:ankyrin repeat-containing domain protein [Leptodontidium sp. MPI-SDFR-AT-0119]|nr:ankyrin repeat-containing domain protein [Leptodontidium sp. MPI-SDFR-AT-0119]
MWEGKSGDILGWTPLHYAAVRESEQSRKMMGRLGEIDTTDSSELSPLHYAARKAFWPLNSTLIRRSDIRARGRDGMQPLHWAAKFGNKGMLQVLLARSPDIRVADNWRRTVLHLAALGGHPLVT